MYKALTETEQDSNQNELTKNMYDQTLCVLSCLIVIDIVSGEDISIIILFYSSSDLLSPVLIMTEINSNRTLEPFSFMDGKLVLVHVKPTRSHTLCSHQMRFFTSWTECKWLLDLKCMVLLV